ncbi:putative aldose-1-epimerase [Actinomyces bovis]|uniref:Aldose-1-epimerase n=1 Tax=Actinomyces bovis TaxID=1658 RepID=A0ABY1VMS1_9ACTO|nr:aldose-1-epimerase [Actinomyces bovis]SPT52986.1 putative aldose-1-epimerase [Actinomyces bovis]VEG55212.1 putative aldose-1-epimerase [Actinomyces israelii]
MLNGELITLTAGDYQAEVASCGGMLVSLSRQGRDLIVPFDAEATLPSGWQGKTMLPWPNRIAGSTYTRGGRTFQVACNEPERGAANHGLVSWTDWEVTEVSADAASFETLLPASYGYPWALLVTTTYRLHPVSGLSVTTQAICVGAALATVDAVGAPEDLATGALAAAPYGVAAHPYLSRGVKIDDCVLTLPGAKVLETDAQLTPTELRDVAGTEQDWRAGKRIGATLADNAFTGLPQGVWEIRLACAAGGPAVVLSADTPWAQIYTADHMGRRGLAVEPMTCPANAFNTGESLIELELGAEHTLAWNLREED